MKRLDHAYLKIAGRALDAAAACSDARVHEKAGFLAYHGFESAGGAYCEHHGTTYPKSHKRKVQEFVAAVKRERFGKAVAQLAIELASVRNLLLYPRVRPDGSVCLPEDVITAAQARRLVGRLRALVGQVGRDL